MFEVATSKCWGEDVFTRKYIILITFNIDLGAKVTRNVAHYPLYHVTYAATKFEAAIPRDV